MLVCVHLLLCMHLLLVLGISISCSGSKSLLLLLLLMLQQQLGHVLLLRGSYVNYVIVAYHNCQGAVKACCWGQGLIVLLLPC
jgi:hypothetical protein